MTDPHSSARPDPRPNLFGLDIPGLRSLLSQYAAPGFHATQLYRWMYARRRFAATSWTDLPHALRERLERETDCDPGQIVDRVDAADKTTKYRIRLSDGASIESVYMEQEGRVTLCLSSQVGCALDCDFCLTGKMGFIRHLGPGEIVGQLALILEDKQLEQTRFNVVFMGMGEPLHNYAAVLAAFRLMTDADGFAISRRRITVSTSGLAPAIEQLAAEARPPRLAISLNATSDTVRAQIMPINRKYPIGRLIEACRHFCATTGDAITFEYVLLAGINDGNAEIDRLAARVRGLPAKVNLIPFNEVPGWLDYRAPTRERVRELRDRLLERRVAVSIRWSRGAEARAACGQLSLLPNSPDRGVSNTVGPT